MHHYYLSHKHEHCTIYTLVDVQINLIYRSIMYSKFHRLKWWSSSWSHSNIANCLCSVHTLIAVFVIHVRSHLHLGQSFYLLENVFLHNFFIIRFMLQTCFRLFDFSLFAYITFACIFWSILHYAHSANWERNKN